MTKKIIEARIQGAEEQAKRAKQLKRRLNDLWTANTDTQEQNINFELTDEEAENLIVHLIAASSYWEESAKKSREKLND